MIDWGDEDNDELHLVDYLKTGIAALVVLVTTYLLIVGLLLMWGE